MSITAIIPQSFSENLTIILASCRKYYVELAIAGSTAYAGYIYFIILTNLSFDDVSDVYQKAALVIFIWAFAGIYQSAAHRADATDIAALNIAEYDE